MSRLIFFIALMTVIALDGTAQAQSARLIYGSLVVEGTNSSDRIDVYMSGTSARVRVRSATTGFTLLTESFPSSSITGEIRVYGLRGNDRIYQSTPFTSRLEGGGGHDVIHGGPGSDVIYGNDGDDDLVGGEDSDTLWGGSGNDDLWGGAGDDELVGNSGNDRLYGGNGDDSMYGGHGNDVVSGQNGNDVEDGGPGSDNVWGGNGADLLSGGDGEDYVNGGNHNDRIWGGHRSESGGEDGDADTLVGAGGSDTFYFEAYDSRVGVHGTSGQLSVWQKWYQGIEPWFYGPWDSPPSQDSRGAFSPIRVWTCSG